MTIPAVPSSASGVPKPNPAEALRKKMHRSELVEKHIFGGGRLGKFLLKVDPALLGHYQAGQYIGVGLDTPDGFVVRSYSIAGSPLDENILELYIALVPEGKLTPTIFRQECGSTWYHLTPKGHFTLKKAKARNIVMVATGTGLAPFISKVRTLWKMHRSGVPIDYRIVVIQGASYADELGYREEFEKYAAAKSEGFNLMYIPTASRPDTEGRGWTPATGRGRVNDVVRWLVGQPVENVDRLALPAGLDREAFAAHISLHEPAQMSWLACGNPNMIEDARAVSQNVGIGTFLAEEFWKA